MFVVRIAEIEVHPEWLEAYLAAAGTVGAESVAYTEGSDPFRPTINRLAHIIPFFAFAVQ